MKDNLIARKQHLEVGKVVCIKVCSKGLRIINIKLAAKYFYFKQRTPLLVYIHTNSLHICAA